MYQAAGLCQKHYFRMRRTGSIERIIVGRNMIPSGYIKVWSPKHRLAQKSGYVFEHRLFVYDKYGEDLPPCEICGASSNWDSRATHIDHIDRNRQNNSLDNLRVLCNSCNSQRDRKPATEWKSSRTFIFRGKKETIASLARIPGVYVSRNAIAHRLAKGMDIERALFSEKKTHNGKLPPIRVPPPKHTRSNAIALTIGGITLTAAEWARDLGCTVRQETIIYRFKRGVPHRDCVFMPPSTGSYKKSAKARELKKQREKL